MHIKFDTFMANIFMPPLKKGAYCFATVSQSVFLSACRPSVVCSISFDHFTWSIPNLVQGLPLMSRWSLLIFKVTCSKVKVKLLFWAQCVVHFIYFNPFVTCFVQVLLLQRRLTWILHHGGHRCFLNIWNMFETSETFLVYIDTGGWKIWMNLGSAC